MDIETIAIMVGIIVTVLGSLLAVVRFVDKKWQQRFDDLRVQIDQRFNDLRVQVDQQMEGFQLLCKNDMKHMGEDIKGMKKKLDQIWDELEDRDEKKM